MGSLTRHQAEVCFGPELSVRHFEHARVVPAHLVTNRFEGAKAARDSVVMSRDGTKLIAGRVRAFLAHSAPGVHPDPENEAYIADVKWYAHVAPSHVAAHRSMAVLGCPMFRSPTPDNKRGKFWPVSKLLQCKLAALPHDSGKDTLVILTRFQADMPEL